METRKIIRSVSSPSKDVIWEHDNKLHTFGKKGWQVMGGDSASQADFDNLQNTVTQLANRVNNALDSDDATLDQLSEIVAYIKDNKDLIGNLTKEKVSVDDIVNTLTSTDADKPLSAAQGKALKDLVDAMQKSVNSMASTVGTSIQTVKVDGTALNVTDNAVDINLQGKVDVVEGKSLVSDTLIEKLNALPTAANLTATLSKKVDKEEGKSLISDTLVSKLEALPTQEELQKILDGFEDDIDTLIRDLAQYEEETPLTLTVGQTGKYVSNTGVVTTNSSYNMSAQVDLKKGYIYLIKPTTALATGVALCAEYTTEDKDVVIEYTKTYDSDNNVLTATADYDSTVKYTYNYETDTEGKTQLKNITDKNGNVVEFIPEYRTVSAGSYVPLFKNLSTTTPKSGYYAVLCNDNCKAVFSLPSADLSSTTSPTVIVASYGIFRSIINNKEDKAVVKKLQEEVQTLKNSLATMSEQNMLVGFSRMNGSADPAADSEDVFGKKAYIHDIGTHLHLGIVKDGVVVKTAKAGRLTVDTAGNDIAIDGSEGDVMWFTDTPLELLKARDTISGVDTNVIGLSLIKSAWNGNVSKTLDRFAVTPDETVNCSLDGDTRSQAHSIYNTTKAGTYNTKSTMFEQDFRTSGGGVPHHYVSGITAIQQAQNKNADALTNRPYMGFYYEFYEAILALMFAECGTVYVNAPTLFGCGCTPTHGINASTFADTAITGNSGIKFMNGDGGTSYQNWMTQIPVNGTNTYIAAGLVGNCYYTLSEMLEPQRILDAVAKAGLISNIGNSNAVFTYDADGNMTVTTDGSIDVATGTGMEKNKKYYIIRDVPNCEGMSDGVMTAVINSYLLMDCVDGVTISNVAYTQAIFKFSYAVYRGFSLPLHGAFRQMVGAHYVYGQDTEGNYTLHFMCASNVDNLPALTTFTTSTFYGDKGSELEAEKGLDIDNDRSDTLIGNQIWCKDADYSTSLFDAIHNGGSISSYESMYRWIRYCYGAGTNGRPDAGKDCVIASAVGCYASSGAGSLRSLNGFYALSNGNGNFAGAFAVPHLALA